MEGRNLKNILRKKPVVRFRIWIAEMLCVGDEETEFVCCGAFRADDFKWPYQGKSAPAGGERAMRQITNHSHSNPPSLPFLRNCVCIYIPPSLSLPFTCTVDWIGLLVGNIVTRNGNRRKKERESLLELRAIDNPPTGRTALEDILRLNCVCGVNGNPIPSRFAIYRRKFAVRTLESARDQIWMRGKTRPI